MQFTDVTNYPLELQVLLYSVHLQCITIVHLELECYLVSFVPTFSFCIVIVEIQNRARDTWEHGYCLLLFSKHRAHLLSSSQTTVNITLQYGKQQKAGWVGA